MVNQTTKCSHCGKSIQMTAALSKQIEEKERMITALKKSEEDLRESENKFKQLSESVFEGVVITEQGKFVAANRAFLEIHGYTHEEILKMTAMDVTAPQSRETVRNNILTGYEKAYEVMSLKKDGTEFAVKVMGRSIVYQGRKARITSILDISEQRKTEQMKNEFLSTVSHELRTPLSAITLALEILENQREGLPEQGRSLMGIALNNSKRLQRLINDLLDFERIESGKISMEIGPVELGSVINHCLEDISVYARNYDVVLKLQNPLVRARVRADVYRLAQVLTNLLANAIKFSPRGETVSITVSRREGSIRVAVSDRGLGITDAFRDRIFEKFSQADASDTRQKGGTGLGLSISKVMIENMNGQIGFETSITGQTGTTFYFDLPEAQ